MYLTLAVCEISFPVNVGGYTLHSQLNSVCRCFADPMLDLESALTRSRNHTVPDILYICTQEIERQARDKSLGMRDKPPQYWSLPEFTAQLKECWLQSCRFYLIG